MFCFRHGVALWRLNKDKGELEKVFDIPGCGDTAFPSIVRVGRNKYLIANYTSPTTRCADWSWVRFNTIFRKEFSWHENIFNSYQNK